MIHGQSQAIQDEEQTMAPWLRREANRKVLHKVQVFLLFRHRLLTNPLKLITLLASIRVEGLATNLI